MLRLKLHDNSEFLLEAQSQNEMVVWLDKIKKFAGKFSLTGNIVICFN